MKLMKWLFRLFIAPFRALYEFWRSFYGRLRTQGPSTTLHWLRTVGLAWATGRLSLRFSRVTPHIYLGPQYGRYGKRTLEQAGITASMSMRAEYDDATHDLNFEDYSYLPTVDNTAPTMAHLQEGVQFIQNVVDEGGTIYIHCGSGVGRAPTMVAAYLISTGKSVDEAIEQIQAARPFVRILPPQIERLEEFAAMQLA